MSKKMEPGEQRFTDGNGQNLKIYSLISNFGIMIVSGLITWAARSNRCFLDCSPGPIGAAIVQRNTVLWLAIAHIVLSCISM